MVDTTKDKDSAQENVKQEKVIAPVKEITDWKGLKDLDSLPLMKSGYSLEADMKFGWKP